MDQVSEQSFAGEETETNIELSFPLAPDGQTLKGQFQADYLLTVSSYTTVTNYN